MISSVSIFLSIIHAPFSHPKNSKALVISQWGRLQLQLPGLVNKTAPGSSQCHLDKGRGVRECLLAEMQGGIFLIFFLKYLTL